MLTTWQALNRLQDALKVAQETTGWTDTQIMLYTEAILQQFANYAALEENS